MLLTFRQLVGTKKPSERIDIISEKDIAFVTRLSLVDALRRLKDYEHKFKAKHPNNVLALSLLTIVEIPPDTDIGTLSDFDVDMIEALEA